MELQNLFTMVINMTITGSLVILCVLAARLVLKRAPRVFSWVLWLAVVFRLLCPVSVPGPASVLALVEAPRAESGAVEYFEPPVQAPLETMQVEPGQIEVGTVVETIPVPHTQIVDWSFLGSRAWGIVSGILFGYGIISYVNLKRKLRESVPLETGVRESDRIQSPFVLGRTIYLPAGLRAEERDYIVLHERLHIRYGDPVVKLLFWLAVCIHWFNPLVWLAFFLCGRDMELRCDEAVLKKLGGQIRSDYAQSLLDLAAGRQFAPAPLAFGEGDTGKRVKFVLNWKKSKRWAAVFGAVFCAAVLLLTACDPAEAGDSPFGHSYWAESSYASAQVSLPSNTCYTLTADMGLFIRSEETELAGFFREASAAEYQKAFSGDFRRGVRRCWHIADSGWWLLERKNGDLQLHDLNRSVVHSLARTDLLGVTIKQSGMESYVEPVWHRTEESYWPAEELSVTLVDGKARVMLQPEQDVAGMLVSEEYYERQPDGETCVTIHDHFLERDTHGDFSLTVSRRGVVGDDYAIYRVTVGEDHFAFRLAFPAVPGETTVSVGLVEAWREVRYEEHGAFITLQIPESWAYDVTLSSDEAIDAGIAGGISFWPTGKEEGKIFFGFYPDLFAVCGTGLENEELVLAGQKVSVGTYDGRDLWDFIRFDAHFAAWGQGHESWWTEHGDTAMAILDSAKFGE